MKKTMSDAFQIKTLLYNKTLGDTSILKMSLNIDIKQHFL